MTIRIDYMHWDCDRQTYCCGSDGARWNRGNQIGREVMVRFSAYSFLLILAPNVPSTP
jgi:hypothetical protein